MNRIAVPLNAVLVLAALAAGATCAAAQPPTTKTIALGFHSTSEPIGGRWWFMENLAADVGFGFDAEKGIALLDTNDDGIDDRRIETTLGRWSVEVGMPWTAWRWEGVRVSLRPGLSYQSEDEASEFALTGRRVKLNSLAGSGEIEVEVPIAANVTLSASHGMQFTTSKLDESGAQSTWSLSSYGLSFTQLGFHVYLWTTP